jgi:riboflavin synthase
MFTGIIETLGRVVSVETEQANRHFVIESEITPELKVDQSVAHNGVCLTITQIEGKIYHVTAIHETLLKSNLGEIKPGEFINLERCMLMGGRLDGHIVQGHVDTTGIVKSVRETEGSWEYIITYDPDCGHITVPKGSVTINGVSLTVVKSEAGLLSVAIIPYTYHHTNFNNLKAGMRVNLEFDIIGKYVATLMQQKNS